MKTIKQEEYKGYEIITKAEYREDTTTYYGSSFENLDSVKFEVITTKGFFPLQRLKGSVEEGKSKRELMYDTFNRRVEDLIKTAKENIDKREREKEMTDGLPESLLSEDHKDMREVKKDDLYNAIYTVCEQAVKDLDSKKTKEFLDVVRDALKREKGLR